jgi:hypothetical protein
MNQACNQRRGPGAVRRIRPSGPYAKGTASEGSSRGGVVFGGLGTTAAPEWEGLAQ